MTLRARAWLPANALADATVQRLVQGRASDWARRWLPDPREIAVATHSITPSTKIPKALLCCANAPRTVALAIDDASAARLATQMIAAPAGGKLNAPDLSLYRRLAQNCCLDLALAMAALFESDRNVDLAPQIEVRAETKYTLSWAGGPSLHLYVDNALILGARRSAASGARPGSAFGAMSEALGRQTIQVGAAIGAATIGLDELYGLGRGDVIVLDRPLEDGVLLTINDCVASGASAVIQRAETGLELRVTGFERT